MQAAYSDSGSGSDSDEAPEEVSLQTAKKDLRDTLKQEKLALAKQAAERKAKARSADAKRKAAKKGKAKLVEEDAQNDEDENESESAEEGGEGKEDGTSSPKGKRTTFSSATTSTSYLDPAIFASAASFFAPAAQPAKGTGKMAQKRAIKAEKRLKRQREKERQANILEGGAVSVGDITLQHLPTPTYTSSLTSSSRPSHTSATKFVASRLYSKKRVVALVDAGLPAPISERKRHKKGGGMSEESKILLGMGMDDGAKQVSEEALKEQAKDRKKSLLLQAEGRRKPATLARPLASARAGTRPAQHFAVATRTR